MVGPEELKPPTRQLWARYLSRKSQWLLAFSCSFVDVCSRLVAAFYWLSIGCSPDPRPMRVNSGPVSISCRATTTRSCRTPTPACSNPNSSRARRW